MYLSESEADVTCCFCNKMHQCSTGRSSGGLSHQEIGLEEESRLRLSSRMVDYTRDDAGSHLVTYQVDGVDYDGSQASRQDTVRFSNTGDATMTSKTTQPHALSWSSRKCRGFPSPSRTVFYGRRSDQQKISKPSKIPGRR